MAGKSIGELNAKITADASQFVAEFTRADNASRRSAAAISKEVDKLVNGVSKKFSLSSFGGDLLKGVGLGSGFAIAQQSADLAVGYWREAAELAKKVEDSSQRQLDSTLALIKSNQTNQQQMETALKRQAQLYRELAAIDPNSKKFDILHPLNYFLKEPQGVADRAAKTEEIQRAAAEAAAAQKRLQDEGLKNFADLKTKAWADSLQAEADLYQARGHEQELFNAKLEDAAKIIEANRTPTDAYLEQLKKIDDLSRYGLLSGHDASLAKMRAANTRDEAINNSVAKELEDFFAPLDEASDRLHAKELASMAETNRIVGLSADGMASAWVDALNGVEGAWSNFANTVIHEIEKIAVQVLLVKPLINSLGGIVGGLGGGLFGTLGTALSSYGGGKAVGGPVSYGKTYLVGEDGPELFTPSSSGDITSNSELQSGRGGRSGSYRPNITYNIDARGADRTGLAELAEAIRQVSGSIEPRALAAVMNQRRRA